MKGTINTIIEYLPHAGHGAKHLSCSLCQNTVVNPVNIPILQMRKLRLGETKSHTQSPRTR